MLDFNAGFQNVSLHDVAITTGGAAVTVPGVYEQIEGNYRKAIMIHGLTLDDKERAAFVPNFKVSGTDFVAVLDIDITLTGCDIYTLTIGEDDDVAVTKSSIKSAT